MLSQIQLPDPATGRAGRAEYGWVTGACRNALWAEFEGLPDQPSPGSEQEFIAEHYWGYVLQRGGTALEYGVEHPPWRVWRASSAHLDCDVAGCYGTQYCAALGREPTSAFVAEGSAVTVFRGDRLTPVPAGA
jgi:hypothetical protein